MVSVVIPTRNKRVKTLSKMLESQIYRDFEIIIQVDSNRNGAPWARNQGLKESKGEYVLFLDDDILLDPHFLDKMVTALDKNPDKSFAYCNFNRTGDITIPHRAIRWNPDQLRNTNYISTMSLVRKKDCPKWDESLKRYQDWDLWLTMAEQGKEGIHIDEFLFTASVGGGITTLDKKDIIEKENIVRRKHCLELLCSQ